MRRSPATASAHIYVADRGRYRKFVHQASRSPRFKSGSVRIRLLVAAKIALLTAGSTGGRADWLTSARAALLAHVYGTRGACARAPQRAGGPEGPPLRRAQTTRQTTEEPVHRHARDTVDEPLADACDEAADL